MALITDADMRTRMGAVLGFYDLERTRDGCPDRDQVAIEVIELTTSMVAPITAALWPW